jgi:DNA helicase-2/ATP-dependent DNA helicase PcrA
MTGTETFAFNTGNVTVHLAAAGAGKTSAIIGELARLLEVYRPDEIAFVTYTRKGVANGMERALRANPSLSPDDLVHFKTLHALCFRELGLGPKAIITGKRIGEFNRENSKFNLTMREAFETPTKDDRLLTRYDVVRSGSAKAVLAGEPYDAARYNELITAYEGFKAREGLVDFHDCLLRFREAGRPVGVKAAFIDEAQDLTPLQWEVCRTAFSACEKIVIAGDDYQSLFTYAGASPGTLISLAERYGKIKHETSYRLPASVYRFARGITDLLQDKIDKDFKPAKNEEGFVEELSDRNVLARQIGNDLEENGAAPYRWYLLFRNNCFISEFAELLELGVIPYHTAKGFCLEREKLALIKRYNNFRKRGCGSREAFEAFCEKHGIEDIRRDFTESRLLPSGRRHVYSGYVRKYGIDRLIEMADREPSVLLSTIHRVKGGEADFVAVFLECSRKAEENRLTNIDEELRALYVACTRARKGLYLVSGGGKHGLEDVVYTVKRWIA